jgi:hypothetical protein
MENTYMMSRRGIQDRQEFKRESSRVQERVQKRAQEQEPKDTERSG